jgi:hypothetical protein
MSKRKRVPPQPAPPNKRRLAPVASSSRGLALRVVLLAAAATSGGCEWTSPREWPDQASAAARRAGVWIGVIDEPREIAGVPAMVHPPIAPLPTPSTSASASR